MNDLLDPWSELENQGARVIALFSIKWVIGGVFFGLLIGFMLGRMWRLAQEWFQAGRLVSQGRGQRSQMLWTGADGATHLAWRDRALTDACDSLLLIAGQVLAPATVLVLSVSQARTLHLEHQLTTASTKLVPLRKEAITWPKKLWRRAQEETAPWPLPLAKRGASTLPYLLRPSVVSAAFAAPVRLNTALIGLIIVHRSEGAPFQSSEVELVAQIAAQISLAAGQEVALKKREEEANERQKDLARMEHLATHDGLTGLVNQRHFRVLFDSYLAQAERYERRLSLVMLDIDHFKRINDQFGHPIGDRVLKKVASVLRASARRADVVARLGGEEFAILMEETGAGGAHSIAERVRLSIERAVVETSFGDVRTTLSLGIATFPHDGRRKEDLLEHADSALYEAKRTGRNKTVLFLQPPSPAESLSPK